MLNKFKKLLARHWSTLVIVSAWFLVVVTNYDFGTSLIGWDNLLPEQDITHDLWRSINMAWQEYQGLGLLGGMAHAADLPRQLLILIFGWLLPKSLIRYVSFFSLVLAGALGARQLFQQIFANARYPKLTTVAATAAGLFYLLNLGTVMNLYVAFEPFYWFYGACPWLLYLMGSCWRRPQQRGYWAAFGLVSFFTTTMSYVQTNFLVYAAAVAVLASVYLLAPLLTKNWQIFFKHLKAIFLTGVIIFLANAFWLLPAAYYVLSGSSNLTAESQTKQISTPETRIENQMFTNPLDIMLLRGYWWAYDDYEQSLDAHEGMFKPWQDYPPTLIFGCGFALLALAGLVHCLKGEQRLHIPLQRQAQISLGLLFIVLVGLLLIHNLDWGVVREIFRSPYIKVITPLSLVYALLVGNSFFYFRLLGEGFPIAPKLTKHLATFSGAGFLLVLLIYIFPAFTGNYFYARLRVKLPAVYSELYDFLHTLAQSERLALLPANSIFGWQFNTWGYRGDGIYWYGVRQAQLNRGFDMWSKENETFFREIYYAREQAESELFSQILKKYAARYLLFDDSIYTPGKTELGENQAWLALINATQDCQRIWQKESLQVFDCGEITKDFLRLLPTYSQSATAITGNFYDPVTPVLGDYVTPFEETTETKAVTTFPWAFLYRREVALGAFRFQRPPGTAQASFTLTGELAPVTTKGTLLTPGLDLTRSQKFLFSAQLGADEQLHLTLQVPFDLYLNGQAAKVFPAQQFVTSLPADITEGEKLYFDFGSDVLQITLTKNPSSPQFITLTNFQIEQTWHFFAASHAQDNGHGGFQVDRALVSDLTVPLETWQEWQTSQSFPLTQGAMILEAKGTAPVWPLRDANERLADNCDALGRGVATKERGLETSLSLIPPRSLLYQNLSDDLTLQGLSSRERAPALSYFASGQGTYCDTFYHPSLDNSKASFVFLAEAANYTGRPLSFYWWYSQTQTSPWEKLFAAGLDQKVFSFPRTPNVAQRTLDFHLANRSLAGEVSVNEFLGITAYEVPSTYLAQVRLVNQAVAATSNPFTLTATKKSGTSSYQALLQRLTSGSGVLQLAQGYHHGWQAKINGQELEHLRANSWANAWLIPDDQCLDSCQVKIEFTPQRWGWLGLFLTFSGSAAGAIIYYRHRREKRRHLQRLRARRYLATQKALPKKDLPGTLKKILR